MSAPRADLPATMDTPTAARATWMTSSIQSMPRGVRHRGAGGEEGSGDGGDDPHDNRDHDADVLSSGKDQPCQYTMIAPRIMALMIALIMMFLR